MRRVTLSLVVLAVVGLAASTAWAGSSSPKVALQVGPTLVAHHGPHGHGHRGHHPHRYYPHRSYRRGPVVVRPPLPPPPPVIYSYPSYYRHPSYYYGPSSGIHYRGPGFGISIGF